MDAALQSPLVAALLPATADTLQLGGPAAMDYAGAALGLMQSDAQGNPEPVGIAGMDLMLELNNEGRIHPLIDPFTNALSDPQLAAVLRVGSAVLDDFVQNPADLATFNQIVDGLVPCSGPGCSTRS